MEVEYEGYKAVYIYIDKWHRIIADGVLKRLRIVWNRQNHEAEFPHEYLKFLPNDRAKSPGNTEKSRKNNLDLYQDHQQRKRYPH